MNDQEKPRFSLIPPGPLLAVARVFTTGAKKHSDRGWQEGGDFSELFDSMMRHAWSWWNGEDFDPDDGQHHLDSVASRALMLRELVETHPERDDRPTTR